jgi:hypothetical protein
MYSRLVLTLAISALTACSFVERNTLGLFSDPQPSSFESEAPAQNSVNSPSSTVATPTAETLTPKGIEIIWAIPSEPVEGYVIRYGLSRDSLSQEKRIEVAKLERFEDPQFGYVYRTTIDEAPQQNLFVSLVAYNGTKLSAPSPVFEVKSR